MGKIKLNKKLERDKCIHAYIDYTKQVAVYSGIICYAFL